MLRHVLFNNNNLCSYSHTQMNYLNKQRHHSYKKDEMFQFITINFFKDSLF